MKNLFAMVVVASWALFVPFSLGCEQQPKEGKTNEDLRAKSETMKDYPIEGEVVAVGQDKKTVTIDHKDIPDLMKGMKMEFTVEDSTVLEGIEAGDGVQGRLKVEGDDYIITSLRAR